MGDPYLWACPRDKPIGNRTEATIPDMAAICHAVKIHSVHFSTGSVGEILLIKMYGNAPLC